MLRTISLLTAGVFLWSILPARAQEPFVGDDWYSREDLDPPVYAEPVGDFPVAATFEDGLLLDSNHGYSLMMLLDGVAFYGPDLSERWRLDFPDEYGVEHWAPDYDDPFLHTFGTVENGTLGVLDGSVYVSFKDGHLRRFSTEDGRLLTDYNSYKPLVMVSYHEPTGTLVVLPLSEDSLWTGTTIFVGDQTRVDDSCKNPGDEYRGAGFIPGENRGILWVYTSRGYILQTLDFPEQRVAEWALCKKILPGDGFLYAFTQDELVRITPESGLNGEARARLGDAEIFQPTEDALYLAGPEKLVCLDLTTLDQRWETKTYRGGGWAGDSFRGFTKLYALENEILLVGDDTGLACFNLDGSDRWVQNYRQSVFSPAEQFAAVRVGILGYSLGASIAIQILFGLIGQLVYLAALPVAAVAGHTDPLDGFLGVAGGRAFFWDCDTARMTVGGIDETSIERSKLIIVDLETGEARCLIGRPPAFKEAAFNEWGPPVVYDWIDGVLIASDQGLLSAYDPSTLKQLWYHTRPLEAERLSMRQLYCEETAPGYGMTTEDMYPIGVRLFHGTGLRDLTYEDRLVFDPHTGPVGVFRTGADGTAYWDDEHRRLFTPGWPAVVYDLSELYPGEETVSDGGTE
jgi:outer membrane protein assembly factor BamB